jgi:hypothetical protein
MSFFSHECLSVFILAWCGRDERGEWFGLAVAHHVFADYFDGGVDDGRSEKGAGIRGWGGGKEFVGFVVGFEKAVFALEFAFGGGDVAEHEVVHFDLFWGPGKGRAAEGGEEKIVVLALRSDSVPLTLGGAEDEIVFERFWTGLVAMVPAGEEDEPALFAVGREDEGFGAGAVFEGVL